MASEQGSEPEKEKQDAEKKGIVDQIISILEFFKESDKSKKEHKLAKVGVVTALVGGIFKATALTQTFPQPFDIWGNVILFVAFMIMLADFLCGGFLD